MTVSLVLSIVVLLGSVVQMALLKPNTPYIANSISPLSVSDSFDSNDTAGVFDGQKVVVPREIAEAHGDRKVLGIDLFGSKTIQVDLSTQTLTAFENGRQILQALVSTGKWGATPTGTFRIWGKFRFTKMSGGRGSDYYYLPNVPFVMFFSNSQVAAGRGFSLHGTYWHNNFGHPMSHGCVNMRTADAGTIFGWAGPQVPEGKNSITATTTNPGTEIIITGITPRS